MFEKLKKSWWRFKTIPPGRRFQQQFARRQKAGCGVVQKVLFIGGGLLLIFAGIFFLFVPGPGLLILFFGAALIARQSLFAARLLDDIEVHVRKLLTWSLREWHRCSPTLKILLVILALVIAGVVGLGAVKILIVSHGLGTVA